MLNRQAEAAIVDAFTRAEASLQEQIADGRVGQEPAMTDRLVGHVQGVLEVMEVAGVSIAMRTLEDRGPDAAEHEFGPDLVLILHIQTRDFEVDKGLLIQAKRAGREGVLYRDPPSGPIALGLVHNRVREQCEDMLKITPDSYLWVYTGSEVRVVPALSVVSKARRRQVVRVASIPLGPFIRDFVRCVVGDRYLDAYDDVTLRRLQDRYNARLAAMLTVEDNAPA